jgi:NADH:ubiquinone oxidoreductase subunit E
MSQFQDTQVLDFSQFPIPIYFEAASQLPAAPKSETRILICQRPDCMRRGGQAICQALKSALSDLNLEDQVSLRQTGCMKQCKDGPNIIFMPDKTRYSGISPEQVPELVEKHFCVTGNCIRANKEL